MLAHAEMNIGRLDNRKRAKTFSPLYAMACGVRLLQKTRPILVERQVVELLAESCPWVADKCYLLLYLSTAVALTDRLCSRVT
jgi:hypothetical protein